MTTPIDGISPVTNGTASAGTPDATQSVQSTAFQEQMTTTAGAAVAANETASTLSELKDKAPQIYRQIMMSMAEDCVRQMQRNEDHRRQQQANQFF